jgi:hypothetical protein
VIEGRKFLFVPVSGPGGAGEYYRSLAVASAVERRWPGCEIRFVLSRDARYGDDAPYPLLHVDRSPTYETGEVMAILERERPDVVVFDSAGRAAQYRCAKKLGARIVFVSSRATTRRKGFRFRRMRWTDQLWVVAPRFLGGGLGVLERMRVSLLPRCEVVFLDVLHEPVDEAGTGDLQRRLGVEPGRYVLACPGGGGVFGRGPDAAQVFYDASCELASRAGMPVVAVLGPRFALPPSPPPGVHVLAGLPNAQLMGMLRDARIGVINGGSLLLQALELRAPCVAAPISEDQPPRIAGCAARGLVRPAALEVASLVREVTAVLADGECERLRSRLDEIALANGLDLAVEALERLLSRDATRRG